MREHALDRAAQGGQFSTFTGIRQTLQIHPVVRLSQVVADFGDATPGIVGSETFMSSGMCRDASLRISRNRSNAARLT